MKHLPKHHLWSFMKNIFVVEYKHFDPPTRCCVAANLSAIVFSNV